MRSKRVLALVHIVGSKSSSGMYLGGGGLREKLHAEGYLFSFNDQQSEEAREPL